MAIEPNPPAAEREPPVDQLSAEEVRIARGEDREPLGSPPQAAPSEPPTELPAGREEPSSGDDTEVVEESTSWYSDDDRALAESYGLSEEQLKGFENQADFRRAALFFDQQLAASVTKTAAPTGEQPPPATPPPAPPAPPAPVSKQPPAPLAPPPAAPPADADDIDVEAYVKAGYDEDTLRLVRTLKAERDGRKSLDAEFQKLKQGFEQFQTATFQAAVQQDQQREMNGFHDVLDGLGEDRFGQSIDEQGRVVQLSKQANGDREKVFQSYQIVKLGIIESAKRAGVEPKLPPQKVLIERARLLAFPDQIRQQERGRIREQIAKQSSRRRPVASTRNMSQGVAMPVGAETDEAVALANDPKLKKLWNQLHDEVGADG